MASYGQFRGCYEQSASVGRPGFVSISWTMTTEGTVEDATVCTEDGAGKECLDDPDLQRCIHDTMVSLSFPKAERPTKAGWTFSFTPRPQ